MPNVLNNLAADIYKAADVVGRELVGFIPSVTINSDAVTRAAKGDVIRSHFTRTPTVNTTFAPSMTIPEGTDQTVDNKTFSVNNYASVQIPWTGEDIKHVNNGSGFETIYGDQIKQAMRAIVNTIEAYVFGVAYKGASRAVGTAGTTPFATNHNTLAQVRQVLVDNGVPINDQQTTIVLNTLAGTNLRNLANLQKVNEAGGTDLLRRGTLLDLQGIMIKESAGVTQVTKGTGSGYLSSGTYTAGASAITLSTGTGTVLAGDVVTYAGDTNNYVVGVGVAAPGQITLNDPGLRQALGSGVALTVGGNYTPNVAFHKSAIELAVRPPALPAGGDAAVDMMTVQDPVSGLVFDIAVYKGYMKTMLEVRCLYDAKVWKPQHIATLMG